MAQISVAEAAKQLGVNIARVHQRIADGSLPAVRVGSQWIIDEAALSPLSDSRTPGRPLSQRSAWALVALSRADEYALGALTAVERSRARDRLHHLLERSASSAEMSEAHIHAVAALLRSQLRRRADRRRYRASQRDLPDLSHDQRIVLSGLSHPGSGIASGDLVEGYVRADVVGILVDHYLLSSVQRDQDANVLLHVTPAGVPHHLDVAAPLLLAADLADHRRPREEARAVGLLHEIAKDFAGLVKHDRRHQKEANDR